MKRRSFKVLLYVVSFHKSVITKSGVARETEDIKGTWKPGHSVHVMEPVHPARSRHLIVFRFLKKKKRDNQRVSTSLHTWTTAFPR